MKNLNKITKYLITLFWLGLSCSILKAEIVITELFILRADNSHTPQYIELYNNSNSPVNLLNWSITTIDGDGNPFAGSPYFNNSSNLVNYNEIEGIEIDAFSYFLISSSFCDYPGSTNFDCYFYNENQSDIDAFYLYLPLDGKGTVILSNNNGNVIDIITYNIDGNWPVGEESRGHSLRLHSPELDNSLSENWSLSPDTEKSIWLYDEGEEITSFGSPREENSFQLQNIRYSDFWFSNIEIDAGGTHIIYGDYNNYYNAEPFVDDNGNGIWDDGEEFNDRNNSNSWDYQNNNIGNPLEFSWIGTFTENTPDIKYKLIIEKNDTLISNSFWLDIADATISISPIDLLIDELGRYREIADYTWTVELTKIFTDTTDIIYSDKYTFSIDASDYGIYGCVDDGSCTGEGICPTNAYYESTYKSNHPIECIPGFDCYSALNYNKNANINSNTCHYVSLSIPTFVVGDTNTIARVPIYFKNDSLAEINEIEFVLNFDNSSDILTYDNGTFYGTTISALGMGDENIADDQNGNILVNIPISSVESSFSGAGIITYLDFELVGEQGALTDLSFLDSARVRGGTPENDIGVLVKGGEIVILQTDYEISGQIYYYDSSTNEEPVEVPNVALSLSQKYNGNIVPGTLIDFTNSSGSFIFDSLTEGNYNLSFSKESTSDCNGDYISGTDIFKITRHVTGSEPFNADQFIAADVSLDGTVSGYDASLVAQYDVDLIDNFNDIKTHWIFKPFEQETLLDVYAELLEQNGIFSIEYKPLVVNDKHRFISAYLLGDVNSNYCHDQLSRYHNRQVQFINLNIDYAPVITLPIIISEPTFIEGMDIEIGYDEDVFSPHSITFNTSNIKTERYNSVSNLLSRDGSIKTVTWALDEPQLIEGIIGEVNFEWRNNNKSGKIWLKKFQVNDEPAIGGISLIDLSDNDVVDGVNIINSLVPNIFHLHQNYPNPFNAQTTIKWTMPSSDIVSLEVYNLQGKLVELLFNGQLEAGIHEQIWDATAYPSGIYFYRLISNKKILQRIMLLLK